MSDFPKWKNPADEFVNQPGHWTMKKGYPHVCANCGEDYSRHNPWPQLPCPAPKVREMTLAAIRNRFDSGGWDGADCAWLYTKAEQHAELLAALEFVKSSSRGPRNEKLNFGGK